MESIKFKLFNVLIAYATHNKDVGYCQGLNYIAGSLNWSYWLGFELISFPPSIPGLILIVTKNEEWTFWLLKIIIENIAKSYHTKKMTGLITDIAVLRDLLQSRVPDVCLHIDQCGLPWAVITTKWLICLFAEVLPIETVLRIWDCIFLEGYKVRSLFAIQPNGFIHSKNQIRFRFSSALH